MTTLTQLPAVLDIEVALGDDWSYLFDFDIPLTGYTFVTNVVSAVNGAVTAITVTATSLANGQITLSLTDAQITSLGEGEHKWYLNWTVASNTRQAIIGTYKITPYP